MNRTADPTGDSLGQMPTLNGMLEAVLYYHDGEEEEVAGFYRNVLGLQPVPGGRFGFRLGTSMLLLFNADKSIAQESPPPHGSTGPGHVCFQTSPGEYDAWKAQLADSATAVLEEIEWPEGWREGGRPGRSIYFSDPAGNVLEIVDNDIWPTK